MDRSSSRKPDPPTERSIIDSLTDKETLNSFIGRPIKTTRVRIQSTTPAATPDVRIATTRSAAPTTINSHHDIVRSSSNNNRVEETPPPPVISNPAISNPPPPQRNSTALSTSRRNHGGWTYPRIALIGMAGLLLGSGITVIVVMSVCSQSSNRCWNRSSSSSTTTSSSSAPPPTAPTNNNATTTTTTSAPMILMSTSTQQPQLTTTTSPPSTIMPTTRSVHPTILQPFLTLNPTKAPQQQPTVPTMTVTRRPSRIRTPSVVPVLVPPTPFPTSTMVSTTTVEPGTTTNIPTTTTTLVPMGTDRIAAIVAYINTVTLTNRTLMYYSRTNMSLTTASKEDLALTWLIDEDPLQLRPDTTEMQFRMHQRYALRTLFVSQPTPWTYQRGWASPTTTNDECSWFGITCWNQTLGNGIGRQRVVTEIALFENNLQGTVSPDLGLLSSLVELDLGVNLLQGTLPESIGQFTNLRVFWIATNLLSGSIPSTIGNWDRVQTAWFADNNFTGSVPTTICDAVNLTDLNADCSYEISCSCCDACF